jgi:hypothetical protein
MVVTIRQNLVEKMEKETLSKSEKFDGRLWNRARRECIKCPNRQATRRNSISEEYGEKVGED